MSMTIFKGILIPFLGTSLGAACVLFMKKNLHYLVQRALTGFAAGVMVAAGVWSLLIPSMEQSAKMGRLRFVPAAVGFMLGVLFLLFLDRVIPHLHMNAIEPEGAKSSFQRTTMLVLAVTLHNIPEGMAVGVVYAGWAADHHAISAAVGIIPRYRNTELSRGCDNIHATAFGGYGKGKSLCLRRFIGSCRACWGCADDTFGSVYNPCFAVSSKLCGRCYDLCGGGGAYT